MRRVVITGLGIVSPIGNNADEVAASRKLCTRQRWPTIDVTRRSIEETAAAILDLYREHRLKFIAT